MYRKLQRACYYSSHQSQSIWVNPITLANGIIPSQWKRSSVTPIFKKGARSNVENYRCIAKLPTIAKFFEHLVNVKLLQSVHSQITLSQHGFMKGRSCASNLLEFTHFVQSGLNKGHQIDILYTDFSKAFDRVDHRILVNKLAKFGLPANMLNWIKSYLADRKQFVKFGSSESSEFGVTSGVPQGSHIGPTLFLLFMNDLPDELRDIFISMYADDVKIARIIKSPQDSLIMQEAINKLKQWCDKNNLHLNLDKCVVLTIGRGRRQTHTNYSYGNHIFKRVSEHKDLGVLIDNKMTFTKHIDAITAKATAALGFVKRFCSDINDMATLKSLYYALVQSHLEYCSVVWQPFYDVHAKKLESILKQFTMYARREYPSQANNFRITPYLQRLDELNMSTLERRRANSCLTFMYDILHSHANCPSLKESVTLNANPRGLRRQELLRINDRSMKLALASPLCRMVKFANIVPEHFNNAQSRTNFITLSRATEDATFGSALLFKRPPTWPGQLIQFIWPGKFTLVYVLPREIFEYYTLKRSCIPFIYESRQTNTPVQKPILTWKSDVMAWLWMDESTVIAWTSWSCDIIPKNCQSLFFYYYLFIPIYCDCFFFII